MVEEDSPVCVEEGGDLGRGERRSGRGRAGKSWHLVSLRSRPGRELPEECVEEEDKEQRGRWEALDDAAPKREGVPEQVCGCSVKVEEGEVKEGWRKLELLEAVGELEVVDGVVSFVDVEEDCEERGLRSLVLLLEETKKEGGTVDRPVLEEAKLQVGREAVGVGLKELQG